MVREAREGPLFIFRDGCFLTRQHLVRYVREVLDSVGEDQSQYCSHSFRIGAATAAAERGLEDSVIKTLGRWRSLADLEYIRIPKDQLAMQLLQDTWVMRGIVRVISYLRSFGMWCLGYKNGVFGAWRWVSCDDLFGRATKGFTPLCSNCPQLAPGHTLW